MQNAAFRRGLIALLIICSIPLAFGKEMRGNLRRIEQQSAQPDKNKPDAVWNTPQPPSTEQPKNIAEEDNKTPYEYEERCRHPTKNEADTCSQWRSANATEEQVKASWWGFGTSFIAAIATGFAAWAAAIAAKAAADSNRIAQGNAQRELRAYVYPNELTLIIGVTGDRTTTATIQVQIKNFGQTPAYHVRHTTYLDKFIVPLSKNTPINTLDFSDAHEASIAPSHCMYRGERLPDEPLFHLGKGKIYSIVGEIRYFDAFCKTERSTKYFYGIRLSEFLANPVVAAQLEDARVRGRPTEITGQAIFDIAPIHNEAD